jgi:hypothetical protein
VLSVAGTVEPPHDEVQTQSPTRRCAEDGRWYTRHDFLEWYGGLQEWHAAAPSQRTAANLSVESAGAVERDVGQSRLNPLAQPFYPASCSVEGGPEAPETTNDVSTGAARSCVPPPTAQTGPQPSYARYQNVPQPGYTWRRHIGRVSHRVANGGARARRAVQPTTREMGMTRRMRRAIAMARNRIAAIKQHARTTPSPTVVTCPPHDGHCSSNSRGITTPVPSAVSRVINSVVEAGARCRTRG